jgi:hypothetical protein
MDVRGKRMFCVSDKDVFIYICVNLGNRNVFYIGIYCIWKIFNVLRIDGD